MGALAYGDGRAAHVGEIDFNFRTHGVPHCVRSDDATVARAFQTHDLRGEQFVNSGARPSLTALSLRFNEPCAGSLCIQANLLADHFCCRDCNGGKERRHRRTYIADRHPKAVSHATRTPSRCRRNVGILV